MYRSIGDNDPSDDIWPYITAGVTSIDEYIDKVLVKDESFSGFNIPFSHYQSKSTGDQSYIMDERIIDRSLEELDMSGKFPSWSVLVVKHNNINSIRKEFSMAKDMGFDLMNIRFDALNPTFAPESKARIGVFIIQIASFSKSNTIASIPPSRRGGLVNDRDLPEKVRLELLSTISSQGFTWVEIEDDIPSDDFKSISGRAIKSGSKVMLSSYLPTNKEWTPPSMEDLMLSEGYKLNVEIRSGIDIRKMINISKNIRDFIGDRKFLLTTSGDSSQELEMMSTVFGSDLALLDNGYCNEGVSRDPIRSKTEVPMEFWKATGLIGPGKDQEWSIRNNKYSLKTELLMHIGNQSDTEMKIPIFNSINIRNQTDSIMIPGQVTRNTLDKFLRNIRGMGIRGVSVDMPYMTSCMSHMDWIDTRSRKIGALNLIISKKNKLYGYNTELYAILDVLKERVEDPRGNILVIGCGAGGKAAALASRMLGAKTYLAGSTIDRTEEVAKGLQEDIKAVTYDYLSRSKVKFDVVINTLPANLSIGSGKNGLSVADMMRNFQPKIGLDITRSTLWTPFLSAIESRGGEAIPGSEILVHTVMRDQKLLLNIDVSEEMVEDIMGGL